MYTVHQSNAYDLHIIYSVPICMPFADSYYMLSFRLYCEHFILFLQLKKYFFSVIIMIRTIKKENKIHFTLVYLFVKIHNICCIE